MTLRAGTFLLLAGILLPGCARSVERLPVTPGPVTLALNDGSKAPSTADQEATLRYLGVGGWLIRWRGAELLTAPFFSNPGVFRVGFWSIGPDTARIDEHLPDVADAAAILVGHGHYDHLMDLPYVARRHARDAVIYGSETTVHTLAAFPPLAEDGRLVALNDRAGDHVRPGEWVDVAEGRIRFMALRSSHAPHFMGLTFYAGRRTEALTWTPGIAPNWLEGETLAFLVDLMDDEGRPAFRIYYQDAASQAPAGLLPELAPADRRRVDVAILCPASWDQVEGHPKAVVENLWPRHVLMGHWEDFFRDPSGDLKGVRRTDLQEFIHRLGQALPDDGSWTLPEPGARIFLKRHGG